MFLSGAFGAVILNSQIQGNPWLIIEYIGDFLGLILNFIYNAVSLVFQSNTLGVSIIIFTIIVRALMIPLALKQQDSMIGMRKVQPEVEKIRKKYAGKKDAEAQQRMNAEVQRLYSVHKVNPLSGCLPVIIQMPIFFALSYIMSHTFRYIDKIRAMYDQISAQLIAMPNVGDIMANFASKIPNKMNVDPHSAAQHMDSGTNQLVYGLNDLLNTFRTNDWTALLSKVPSDVGAALHPLITQLQSVEKFLGLSIIDNCNSEGYFSPAMLIPVLAAVTSFLSSYFLNKMMKSNDPSMVTQQRMMLIVFPVMMGFMTINFPVGVGIYWITTSVFGFVQQWLLNKYYKPVDTGNKPDNKSGGKPETKKSKKTAKAKEA